MPAVSVGMKATPATSKTLVALLEAQAAALSGRTAMVFLGDGETETGRCSYSALAGRARAIGAFLQSSCAPGDRVLMLFPPGMTYVEAFFGCLYAGAIACPTYPPTPGRLEREAARLQAVVRDAQPSVVLTTEELFRESEQLRAYCPELSDVPWLTTDEVSSDTASKWIEPRLTEDAVAYLQYTSGSTGEPKGVVISHSNLLWNLWQRDVCYREHSEQDSFNPVSVCWLPPYHDMGLIGGILYPIYSGGTGIIFSPADFIRRPVRWLKAITKYGGTISGAPNFAYELCLRKVNDADLALLNLSTLESTAVSAEPVRRATLERFANAFHVCGLKRRALMPTYGLAEATVLVSAASKTSGPTYCAIQKHSLLGHTIEVAEADDDGPDTKSFVSCGEPVRGVEISIVDPETMVECPSDQIGEIWVSGPSIASGYWGRRKETEITFRAQTSDSGRGPFLRTGDLGFLRGRQLFVTGRLKDVLIVRGRNYYPQDIELAAEQAHNAIRPGGVIAFSVDGDNDERVVVVAEVSRDWLLTDSLMDPVREQSKQGAVEVISAVRSAVLKAQGIRIKDVALVEAGAVPKTTSGKLQRAACRAAYLGNDLPRI